MKPRCLVLLCLVLPSLCFADAPADVEQRLRADLRFLTSDDCQGRGVTTKGIHLAADYIAREFEKAGMKPGGPNRSYFQSFDLVTSAKAGPNCSLVLRGSLGQTITLDHGKHFLVPLGSTSGKAEGDLVFVGHGLSSREHDDYKGLDIKGKTVVLLTGLPRQAPPVGGFGLAQADTGPPLDRRITEAARRGARAVLIVNNLVTGQGFGRTAGDLFPVTARFASMRLRLYDIPVAHLKRDWLDWMLLSTSGRSLVDTEKAIDAEQVPHSRELVGWSCKLETDVSHKLLPVKNVVGVAEGSGPLAAETIVIGAHYDHIGMGAGQVAEAPKDKAGQPEKGGFGKGGFGIAGPGAPGGVGFPTREGRVSAVHHGADDNASGTAAVLELARRFGAMKGREGRRIVLIAFTAEEVGLIGSAHYCRSPLFPLADTVTMINMDMVGRLQDDRLLVSGIGTAKVFPELVAQHNKQHKFTLGLDVAGNGPSDHSSFFNAGVPVLNFFTGFHEQYHRPTDRPETINISGLRRVAGMVGDVAADLAQAKARPVFVRAKGTYDRTKTLWANAPATGVLSKYIDNREGLLVDGVVTGTPAAKAGLKKGDRLIAASGKAISDPATFLSLSRAWKPGEKVELTVLREGKEEKVALLMAEAPAPKKGFQAAGTRFGLTFDFQAEESLRVKSVAEKGSAERAGVRAGDLVVAVAGKEVKSLLEFSLALRDIRPDAKLELTVQRGEKRLPVTLEPQPVVAPGGKSGD